VSLPANKGGPQKVALFGKHGRVLLTQALEEPG
jgi:hypothetical protein